MTYRIFQPYVNLKIRLYHLLGEERREERKGEGKERREREGGRGKRGKKEVEMFP